MPMSYCSSISPFSPLLAGGHGPGSFSQIHSGLVPPQTVQHDLAVLAQIAKLTKPGAHVTVAQAVVRQE